MKYLIPFLLSIQLLLAATSLSVTYDSVTKTVAPSNLVLIAPLTATVPTTGNSVVNKTALDAAVVAGATNAPIQTATIASLIAYTQAATLYSGQQFQVGGYYTNGDGGGGTFRYDSTDTTSADNGGTIIVGASSRRYKLIINGPVNIKAWGARGDDSTDDTASIQAGLDFVKANGGQLYFSPGTYKTTSSLAYDNGTNAYTASLPALIYGARGKSLIKCYGTNQPVLTLGGYDITVSGLRLTYSAQQPATATNAIALGLKYATRINVKDCIIDSGYVLVGKLPTFSSNFAFSCSFSDLELSSYTGYVVYFGYNGSGDTGNIFDNIYSGNFNTRYQSSSGIRQAVGGVYVSSSTESTFRQFNLEWTKLSGNAFHFSDCGGMVMESCHFEGVQFNGTGTSSLIKNFQSNLSLIGGSSLSLTTTTNLTAFTAFNGEGSGSTTISGFKDFGYGTLQSTNNYRIYNGGAGHSTMVNGFACLGITNDSTFVLESSGYYNSIFETKKTGASATYSIAAPNINGTNLYVNNALITGATTNVGTLTIGNGTGNAGMTMNGANGGSRYVLFQTLGTNRAFMQVNSVAESGSDAGSEFEIDYYTDAGVYKGFWLKGSRTGNGVLTAPYLTVSKQLVAGDASGNTSVQYLAAAGAYSITDLFDTSVTANNLRWRYGQDNSYNFYWQSWTNGGVIATPLTISRAGAVTIPGAIAAGSSVTATGAVTGSTLIEKLATFTPTTVGWYRVFSGVSQAGGTLRITDSYNNKGDDLELQWVSNGWNQSGTLAITKAGYYAGLIITQVRVTGDSASSLGALDIYVSDVTSAGPITLYGYGSRCPAFVSSIVVGATAGTGTTKTLSVARGLSTTDQLISSVATGTAPLTVTSTTEVANLRAATATALATGGNIGSNGTAITRVRFGRASAMVGGVIAVADAYVTTSTRIILTVYTPGGTRGFLDAGTRTASTSFTITSSSVLDTSVVDWVAFEP